MKKLFVLGLTVLTMFCLTACNDAESGAKNEVEEVLSKLEVPSTATGNFILDTFKSNVRITWESNNDAIKFNGGTAAVTFSDEEVNVKVTATGVKADLTATKDFNIKVVSKSEVPDETPRTIEAALNSMDDTKVEFEKVTVLNSYSSGSHVTDGENVIYIYKAANLEVGKNYSVNATKTSFGGSPQLKDGTLTLLDDTELFTMEPTEATIEEINKVVVPTDFKYYTVTGTYNKATTTLNDGAHQIGISSYSLSTSTTALAAYDGLEVTINLYITGGYKDYKEVLTYVTAEELAQLEIDPQTKADAVANSLSIGDSALSDIKLPTTGSFDSTISWASSNEAVISTAGVVTRQDDDVTVTLTATITVGTATSTRTFDVKVINKNQLASSDVFISEYSEGNVGTNRIIELYNPSNESVDLSTYAFGYGTNGAALGGPTDVLSGTLAAGETILYYNLSDSGLTELAEAVNSVVNTKLNFNGNDAVGLYKNEILIDIIGQEDGNPGAGWPVGDLTTANVRLIRKAGVGANAVFTAAEWDATAYASGTPGLGDEWGTHTFEVAISTTNLLVAVVPTKEQALV